MINGEKIELLSSEEAVRQDISDGKYTFKQVAATIFPHKSIEQAIWLLRKKMDGDSRALLGLQETLGILKIIGVSENTMRYICNELGYIMPLKKITNEETIHAEQKIKEIDISLIDVHKKCQELIQERKEMVEKINSVKRN